MADYDLAIIGGGLNGTSIARDAAGRSLRVLLLEQGDLAAGASSAASPLIEADPRMPGGLRALWRAAAERDVWMRTAPHLVRPVRCVMPLGDGAGPSWLRRLGLIIHDRLAHGRLPAAGVIELTHDPFGQVLKQPSGLAFAYGVGLADVARLTIHCAVDAAERGADIWTGARCVRADRSDIWRLAVVNRGQRQIVSSQALANATGGWIASVAETVLRLPSPKVSLRRSSQIVVRRLFDHDGAYVFRTDEGRSVHAVPFERDFTLIGTVEEDFAGDPAMVSVASREIAYLLDVANRNFRVPLQPTDTLHALAGVHVAEVGDEYGRDGFVGLQRGSGEAPLLTMFGGDATTARRRAEAGMAALAPFFPMPKPWTADARLPGGNIPAGDIGGFAGAARRRWPFLGEATLHRMVEAYGTRIENLLDGVRVPDDLGPMFGEDLSAKEVRYLIGQQWARFTDDVIWRRSRLGLTMAARDQDRLEQFMKTRAHVSGDRAARGDG
ncbi:glycerol-3-phosphate dehydrogenase [Bradyrhizobium prioriisuperbiae]|uniref:glycerol-3-phosphate dehydrogenase n=1 Tax=Bradyrhizobium prioriisuperbiae TaxID=2854389 RepID=UPI0028E8DB17|nr:glycerol-3-phosphate dehydrogenase [Bradyrhizobium prioritasuperba]